MFAYLNKYLSIIFCSCLEFYLEKDSMNVSYLLDIDRFKRLKY